MGKKGSSKGYSTGNGKKWAVALGIIVLIAIIVVVIIIAIPPNTYTAVETLSRASKSNYLTSESEKAEYETFKKKVGSSTVSRYLPELEDIKTISENIDIILDFHNDYLVFAKDNKNLKNNYKDIKQGLEKAKESQKEIAKLIEKTNKLSDKSSTYLQGAMVDFRNEYINYLKSCKRAIGALEKAYSGSLGKVSFNNPASSLILNTINDYLNVITSNFDSLTEADVKGGKADTYTSKYAQLGLSAKVDFFDSFVENYLNSEEVTNYYEEVTNYYFDKDIQEKYELYNEFFSLYSEKDLKEIISSMKTEGSNVITKTYEGVTDEKGAFNEICSFVKGGN